MDVNNEHEHWIMSMLLKYFICFNNYDIDEISCIEWICK